jgi:hypothetical protein
LADCCDCFSLELIIPIHSPDPMPNCQTARVEIIIAQFFAISTVISIFSPRSLEAIIPACTCGAGTGENAATPTRRVFAMPAA